MLIAVEVWIGRGVMESGPEFWDLGEERHCTGMKVLACLFLELHGA